MGQLIKSLIPIIAGTGALHLKTWRDCDRIFRENEFPFEMDQVQVLLVLYYSTGLFQQEISRILQRDKASINRTVSFLNKKEMVKAVPDKKDKRKTIIQITAEGKRLASKAESILIKYEKELASVLTKDELETFQLLVNKLLAR